ncbi:K+/H+ antiporter subunit F [Falsiroseomonas sp.]|uniref:K+/H+ antiporter subunit F n=1 Tax=Falsiroseomonas sp. TaxID=2870721 RepID=UPI003F728F4A
MSPTLAWALLSWSLLLAQILLVAAMGCACTRALRGPRAQDRVLALDTMYVNAAMLLLVFGIRTGTTHYFEAALLISLLGFAATAALSKFLMRGEVIE